MDGDVTQTPAGLLTSTPGGSEGAPAVDSSSDAGSVDVTARKKSSDDPISSTSDVGDRFDLKLGLGNEVDIFANECNLASMSTEKITENVEDIVSDLENLLGAPTEDYQPLASGSKACKSSDAMLELDEILMSFDESKTDGKIKGEGSQAADDSNLKSVCDVPIRETIIESTTSSGSLGDKVFGRKKEENEADGIAGESNASTDIPKIKDTQSSVNLPEYITNQCEASNTASALKIEVSSSNKDIPSGSKISALPIIEESLVQSSKTLPTESDNAQLPIHILPIKTMKVADTPTSTFISDVPTLAEITEQISDDINEVSSNQLPSQPAPIVPIAVVSSSAVTIEAPPMKIACETDENCMQNAEPNKSSFFGKLTDDKESASEVTTSKESNIDEPKEALKIEQLPVQVKDITPTEDSSSKIVPKATSSETVMKKNVVKMTPKESTEKESATQEVAALKPSKMKVDTIKKASSAKDGSPSRKADVEQEATTSTFHVKPIGGTPKKTKEDVPKKSKEDETGLESLLKEVQKNEGAKKVAEEREKKECNVAKLDLLTSEKLEILPITPKVGVIAETNLDKSATKQTLVTLVSGKEETPLKDGKNASKSVSIAIQEKHKPSISPRDETDKALSVEKSTDFLALTKNIEKSTKLPAETVNKSTTECKDVKTDKKPALEQSAVKKSTLEQKDVKPDENSGSMHKEATILKTTEKDMFVQKAATVVGKATASHQGIEKKATIVHEAENKSAIDEDVEKNSTMHKEAEKKSMMTVQAAEKMSTTVRVAEDKSTTVPVAEDKSTTVAVAAKKSTIVPVAEKKSTTVPLTEIKSATFQVAEKKSATVPAAEIKSTTLPVGDKKPTTVPVAGSKSTTVAVVEKKSTTVPVVEKKSTIVPLAEKKSTTVPVVEKRLTTVPVVEKKSMTVPVVEKKSTTVPLAEIKSATLQVAEKNSMTVQEVEKTSTRVAEKKLTTVPFAEDKSTTAPVAEKKSTTVPVVGKKSTMLQEREKKSTTVLEAEKKSTTMVQAAEIKSTAVQAAELKSPAVQLAETKSTTLPEVEKTSIRIQIAEKKSTDQEAEEKPTTVQEAETKSTTLHEVEKKLTTVPEADKKSTTVPEAEKKSTIVEKAVKKSTIIPEVEKKPAIDQKSVMVQKAEDKPSIKHAEKIAKSTVSLPETQKKKSAFAEKSTIPIVKSAEAEKTPAQKSAETVKIPAQKSAETVKTTAQKSAETEKKPADLLAETDKKSAIEQKPVQTTEAEKKPAEKKPVVVQKQETSTDVDIKSVKAEKSVKSTDLLVGTENKSMIVQKAQVPTVKSGEILPEAEIKPAISTKLAIVQKATGSAEKDETAVKSASMVKSVETAKQPAEKSTELLGETEKSIAVPTVKSVEILPNAEKKPAIVQKSTENTENAVKLASAEKSTAPSGETKKESVVPQVEAEKVDKPTPKEAEKSSSAKSTDVTTESQKKAVSAEKMQELIIVENTTASENKPDRAVTTEAVAETVKKSTNVQKLKNEKAKESIESVVPTVKSTIVQQKIDIKATTSAEKAKETVQSVVSTVKSTIVQNVDTKATTNAEKAKATLQSVVPTLKSAIVQKVDTKATISAEKAKETIKSVVPTVKLTETTQKLPIVQKTDTKPAASVDKVESVESTEAAKKSHKIDTKPIISAVKPKETNESVIPTAKKLAMAPKSGVKPEKSNESVLPTEKSVDWLSDAEKGFDKSTDKKLGDNVKISLPTNSNAETERKFITSMGKMMSDTDKNEEVWKSIASATDKKQKEAADVEKAAKLIQENKPAVMQKEEAKSTDVPLLADTEKKPVITEKKADKAVAETPLKSVLQKEAERSTDKSVPMEKATASLASAEATATATTTKKSVVLLKTPEKSVEKVDKSALMEKSAEMTKKSVVLLKTAEESVEKADKSVLREQSADMTKKSVILLKTAEESAGKADKSVLMEQSADLTKKSVILLKTPEESAKKADKSVLMEKSTETANKSLAETEKVVEQKDAVKTTENTASLAEPAIKSAILQRTAGKSVEKAEAKSMPTVKQQMVQKLTNVSKDKSMPVLKSAAEMETKKPIEQKSVQQTATAPTAAPATAAATAPATTSAAAPVTAPTAASTTAPAKALAITSAAAPATAKATAPVTAPATTPTTAPATASSTALTSASKEVSKVEGQQAEMKMKIVQVEKSTEEKVKVSQGSEMKLKDDGTKPQISKELKELPKEQKEVKAKVEADASSDDGLKAQMSKEPKKVEAGQPETTLKDETTKVAKEAEKVQKGVKNVEAQVKPKDVEKSIKPQTPKGLEVETQIAETKPKDDKVAAKASDTVQQTSNALKEVKEKVEAAKVTEKKDANELASTKVPKVETEQKEATKSDAQQVKTKPKDDNKVVAETTEKSSKGQISQEMKKVEKQEAKNIDAKVKPKDDKSNIVESEAAKKVPKEVKPQTSLITETSKEDKMKNLAATKESKEQNVEAQLTMKKDTMKKVEAQLTETMPKEDKIKKVEAEASEKASMVTTIAKDMIKEQKEAKNVEAQDNKMKKDDGPKPPTSKALEVEKDGKKAEAQITEPKPKDDKMKKVEAEAMEKVTKAEDAKPQTSKIMKMAEAQITETKPKDDKMKKVEETVTKPQTSNVVKVVEAEQKVVRKIGMKPNVEAETLKTTKDENIKPQKVEAQVTEMKPKVAETSESAVKGTKLPDKSLKMAKDEGVKAETSKVAKDVQESLVAPTTITKGKPEEKQSASIDKKFVVEKSKLSGDETQQTSANIAATVKVVESSKVTEAAATKIINKKETVVGIAEVTKAAATKIINKNEAPIGITEVNKAAASKTINKKEVTIGIAKGESETKNAADETQAKIDITKAATQREDAASEIDTNRIKTSDKKEGQIESTESIKITTVAVEAKTADKKEAKITQAKGVAGKLNEAAQSKAATAYIGTQFKEATLSKATTSKAPEAKKESKIEILQGGSTIGTILKEALQSRVASIEAVPVRNNPAEHIAKKLAVEKSLTHLTEISFKPIAPKETKTKDESWAVASKIVAKPVAAAQSSSFVLPKIVDVRGGVVLDQSADTAKGFKRKLEVDEESVSAAKIIKTDEEIDALEDEVVGESDEEMEELRIEEDSNSPKQSEEPDPIITPEPPVQKVETPRETRRSLRGRKSEMELEEVPSTSVVEEKKPRRSRKEINKDITPRATRGRKNEETEVAKEETTIVAETEAPPKAKRGRRSMGVVEESPFVPPVEAPKEEPVKGKRGRKAMIKEVEEKPVAPVDETLETKEDTPAQPEEPPVKVRRGRKSFEPPKPESTKDQLPSQQEELGRGKRKRKETNIKDLFKTRKNSKKDDAGSAKAAKKQKVEETEVVPESNEAECSIDLTTEDIDDTGASTQPESSTTEVEEHFIQESFNEPSLDFAESDPLDLNPDDELLKAALNASSSSEKEPEVVYDEPQHSTVSEAENIRRRNEELALIQAAQDAQKHEVQESTKKVEKYKKPLNIVVDSIQNSDVSSGSVIKEAESTSGDDHDGMNKDVSSDDDKHSEYSSKINQNQELKLTIRKTKTDDTSSILKIYDPQNPSVIEVSPSESETEPEETPIPKLIIKQCSPKAMSPLKVTIKPILKPEDLPTQKSSPKLIIKPIIKPDDEDKVGDEKHHSPKINLKHILKPEEERSHSPKITIKPIVKPSEMNTSPKIKIKPIIKPEEVLQMEEEEESKERIVLKINKTNEKLAKIKVKLSKEGGHAHIVNQSEEPTYTIDEIDVEPKKPRLEPDIPAEEPPNPETVIETMQADSPSASATDFTLQLPLPGPKRRGRPRKIPASRGSHSGSPVVDFPVVAVADSPKPAEAEEPEQVQTRSGRPQRSCRGPSVRTTLGMRPRRSRGGRGRGRGRGGAAVVESVTDEAGTIGGRIEKQPKKGKISESKLKLIKEAAITAEVIVALEKVEQQKSNVFEPAEPELEHIFESPPVPEEEPTDAETIDENVSLETTPVEHAEPETEPLPPAPPVHTDVVMYEEETRMSADTGNSRAQTPAKQVITSTDVIEESQSSVQSTATTESAKAKKASRLETLHEPETIVTAENLAEYNWANGGPYMLQEQVAQFLGIKSFKRKYPGIYRRPVDMQERDFIRESGLASEHLCDLGLTSVLSADILDIMYADFQNKYEEYCKYLRDKQTKDITNKQKALSLAASQEKNKLDIMQQAIESAAQWNTNFNKVRREERKACMDLQTFTINYPKGKIKVPPKPKVGNYPIALVPGQYTDYYKTFTPTEINNLPLNTMLYHQIHVANEEDSQSDGSGSDTDSSSSGSDSSDSDSSEEDCNICGPNNTVGAKKTTNV